MSTQLLGTREQFLEAVHRAPADLTDDDLAIIGSSHPELEQELRQKRARALEDTVRKDAARILSTQQGTAKAAPPTRPAVELARMRRDESWDEFAARCKGQAVKMATFNGVLNVLIDTFKEMNQQIAALKASVAEIQARPAAGLEERLAAIEKRPVGLTYMGVWDSTTEYHKHEGVTCSGSLWACRTESCIGHRPGSSPSWQLCAKGGSR